MVNFHFLWPMKINRYAMGVNISSVQNWHWKNEIFLFGENWRFIRSQHTGQSSKYPITSFVTFSYSSGFIIQAPFHSLCWIQSLFICLMMTILRKLWGMPAFLPVKSQLIRETASVSTNKKGKIKVSTSTNAKILKYFLFLKFLFSYIELDSY